MNHLSRACALTAALLAGVSIGAGAARRHPASSLVTEDHISQWLSAALRADNTWRSLHYYRLGRMLGLPADTTQEP